MSQFWSWFYSNARTASHPFGSRANVCYVIVMKSIPTARLGVLMVLALALGLFTGCQTKPAVDWNARVGTYTFDQAVAELGPPDRQTKLGDDKTVAQWITHRNSGVGFSVGSGFGSGPVGVGASQSVGPSYRDLILTLTFRTDHVLSAWSKNY
jgi:hypothetical protein